VRPFRVTQHPQISRVRLKVVTHDYRGVDLCNL
jgi:hypothetical protein